MEWVEKTGRTVDEAKERALDQLGVAEHDAEVVVLSEPKTGLFGRVRGEARVRARVRPAEPRPKRQRRPRERSRGGRSSTGRAPGGRGGGRTAPSNGEDGTPRAEGKARRTGAARDGAAAGAGDPSDGTSPASRRRRRRRKAAAARQQDGGAPLGEGDEDALPRPASDRRAAAGQTDGRAERSREDQGRGASTEEEGMSEGVTLQEQGEVAKEFLEGLLDRYGLDATVEVRELDEQTVEVAARGDGLGVLVGPKGATLASLQDVTRTVVQRRFPHRTDRILVDVAGYRERRAAALRRFAQQVAAEVLESGAERSLEPMSPADRKVVHDTVVEIEGVSSSSQGEEPHRFVVIAPGG
jgi:spoIIIJ-associated protein